MSLTREEVLHVATLAKIKISDDEILEYQEKLGNIIKSVESIMEVDIDTQAMYTPTPAYNCFDDDVILVPLKKEEVLQNAHKTESGFFVVGGVLND